MEKVEENNMMFEVGVGTTLAELAGDILILLSFFSVFLYAYSKKPSRNMAISHLFFFIGLLLNLCYSGNSFFNEMDFWNAIHNSSQSEIMSFISVPLVVSYFHHSSLSAGSIMFIIMNFFFLYYGISNLIERVLPLFSMILLIAVALAPFFTIRADFLQFIWDLAFIWIGREIYSDNSSKKIRKSNSLETI
ncbi:hypothetical protein ACFWM3_21925 [Gottfriedia sp. NPDC058432]|uniref:hypothetical protein n=1 Tax=Gottfriedia sp. NPDC058432 TaxID=3346497 RepID=UPI0036483407